MMMMVGEGLVIGNQTDTQDVGTQERVMGDSLILGIFQAGDSQGGQLDSELHR